MNRQPARHCRGLTLLETMLALCLVVLIVGMTYPMIRNMFPGQRLRSAADQIRTQWVGARVKAMDTGHVHLFRYELEGSKYSVQPHLDILSTDPLPAEGNRAISSGEEKSKALPEKVFFAGGETAVDTRSSIVDAGVDPSLGWQTGWSNPIYFYPDGTTSTAILRLQNDRNRAMDLQLRGLTGVVTIGEIHKVEER